MNEVLGSGCRPMPLPPWSASPLHGTQRQAGKRVCGASTEEIDGQAAPEAKPEGLSSLLGGLRCEAEALRTRRGTAVLSISPEGSGLGRDRAGLGRGGAPVRPCPSSPPRDLSFWGQSLSSHLQVAESALLPNGWVSPIAAGGVTMGGLWAGGSATAPPSHLRSHSPAGHCCLSSPQGPLRHRRTDRGTRVTRELPSTPASTQALGDPLPGGPRAQLCLSFSEDRGERDRVWRTESLMAQLHHFPFLVQCPGWLSGSRTLLASPPAPFLPAPSCLCPPGLFPLTPSPPPRGLYLPSLWGCG
ncbi:PREDICTED: uncharacterized protein LOC108523326 [Rhinopithecus bieti]|uniref:uncharacterized protein LOC108523326 n=1 Tax=Rhinopithecus bieti TaxID=61621 RepID=UPI00083C3322|nr:PREDICTED: uncharacterized protein LOC108523326 [Rhinopithecus bieti]